MPQSAPEHGLTVCGRPRPACRSRPHSGLAQDRGLPGSPRDIDSPSDTLQRSGVVEHGRANGPGVVRIDARHCPGCNGRCGVGFRALPVTVPEALHLPAGAHVVVSTSARGLRRAAVWVFGPPLFAVAASTAFAHFGAWQDWTVAAVTVLAIGATATLARWKFASSA